MKDDSEFWNNERLTKAFKKFLLNESERKIPLDIQNIKDIREKTDAPMSFCIFAWLETNGHKEEAIKLASKWDDLNLNWRKSQDGKLKQS